MKRVRNAARAGKSEVFERRPHRPSPPEITDQLSQALQIEYQWLESPAQCLRGVVDVISPSNRFTHSVLISAWICENSLDQAAEAEREAIIGSFRARTSY